MATQHPTAPIYHDPAHSRPRDRRNSSRKSFASSLSRSTSQLDAPRTACPKDGDAFSYDPSHLQAWYLPQELWDRLPGQLRSTLAAVQHSGAAVMTGFKRLDVHTESLDHKSPIDELLVSLDDLPPPKFRTTSNASSVFLSDLSSPVTTGSPASQSECASPVPSSFSLSQTMSPLSPISLAPAALSYSDKRGRSRDRSFCTPLEPHDAKYATELSHLRTEALPRLRHLGHKVDSELAEAKRTDSIIADDVVAFENWWVEKKCTILTLSEKGKRLAEERGLASTGMGWCAP